jgi:hypothetical protein
VLQISLGTPSTEILIRSSCRWNYINVAFQVLKAIICCRHNMRSSLSVGTANPYMYASLQMVPLLFWRMQCLKSQHSFPYGLEIMMFWVCNNGGDGTDPITPLQVWLVLLMLHMICW